MRTPLTSLASPLLLLSAPVALAAAIAACGPDSALDAFNEGSAGTGAGTTTTNGTGGSGSGGDGGAPTTSSSGGGSTSSSAGGSGGGEGGAGGRGPVDPFCGDGELNAPAEQCDDGNDTSGDGCSATCDYELSDGCPEADLLVGTTPLTFMGDTSVAQADMAGTCGGTGAGEYIFRIVAGATGTLMATLEGQFSLNNNKLLWMHAQCPADQNQSLACNAGDPAQLALPVSEGAVVYVGADGQTGAEGNFTLTLVIQ